MFNLPFALRFVVGPLLIGGVSGLLFWLQPMSFQALALERVALESWQLWRVISGHLLHSNQAHLTMNLLALLAVWALHGEYYPARRFFGIFVSLSVFCSLCIYFLSPERSSYVGLSGLLHGFLICGALIDIREKIWLGWLLLVGVTAKILHEQWFGASQAAAEMINTAIAIEAHLYGAIGGAISGFVLILLRNKQSESQVRK